MMVGLRIIIRWDCAIIEISLLATGKWPDKRIYIHTSNEMITIDNTHDIQIKNKTKEHIFKLIINEYAYKN